MMINKKRRKNKWIVWVVVIAILGVLAALFLPNFLNNGNGSGSGRAASGTTGATTTSAQTGTSQGSYTEATKGSLTVTVYGSGSLKPQKTYSVFNDSVGKITEINAVAGDTVKEGDVLMRLSSSEIETNIATYEKELFTAQVALSEVRDTGTGTAYYVYAPSAGRLKTIVADEDDDVSMLMQQYGYLAVISRDGKMKVQFTPDNAFALEVGDPCSVWIGGVEIAAVVDQTIGLGGDVSVTISDDENYDVGEEALVTTQQGDKLGSGTLEVNMPVPVTGIGGTVDTVYYEEGDSIASGAKLFYLAGRLPSAELQEALLTYEEARTALDNEKEKQDGLVIRSPIDGVVTSVNVNLGQTLDESTALFDLQSNTLFQVVATVDELDVVNVEIGQTVQVEIDAYPDEVFTGTVSRISGVGTVSGGVATYEVTVVMDENDKLMDGMTASIEIVVAEKQNVVLVPVEAISTSNGQKYVTLSTGLSTTVTTGLSDDENIEILSGVSEGDSVLITRSTSDSSTTSTFPGMGGGMGGMGMMGGGGMGDRPR